MADKEIQDILEQELQRISQIRMQKNSDKVPEVKDICPVCHNSGWEIITDQDGYEVYRKCKCGIYQRQIMQNRLRFAKIPENFKDMRLDSFDIAIYRSDTSRNEAAAALEGVKYWLNNFKIMQERGMGLYLYSEIKGSGKTRMAASVANEVIYKKNTQVKFATSLQILQEIKNTWDRQNNEGYTENKLLEDLARTQILIIDDFGTEQVKDWASERFYQIINGRYIDKKITIFTSNMSLDNLQYDDRITNRIKERTFQIPFPEESVRDIIAEDNLRELINGIRGQARGCSDVGEM